MSRIIIKTDDNSDTVFDEKLQEIFHSQKGALTESQYVFIQKGFNYVSDSLKEINIFEIGFGTGLNTILTLIEADLKNIKVNYFSIESEVLDEEIWSKLNYDGFIDQNYHQTFRDLHKLSWNIQHKISDNFSLKKINQKLEDYSFDTSFNLVYFDAFSPDKQPELWTYEIFKKLTESLENEGVIVTYSAKGQVRRNMEKCELKVEKLPGPPGKREMLRARKIKYIDLV